MSITSVYTLTQARSMLALCQQAYEDLISGQAKAYRVGTREYTALDLDDLVKEIERWSNIIEALESGRSQRVRRIVPRDL